MKDLTLTEEDRNKFISRVNPIIDDNDKFIISYANGKKRVDNNKSFEDYMALMEEQFYEFKDEFLKVQSQKYYLLKSANKLLNFVLIGEGFIFLYNITNKNLNEISLLLIGIIATFLGLYYCKNKMKSIHDKIGNVMATEYYINNKKQFVKEAYDEKNLDIYEYNLVDMNSISQFNSKKELVDYLEKSNVYQPLRLSKQ
ncbi:MAG: hypothetical protein ACI31M_04385 [Bacilli bacterium]